ncbi:MAG: hypothetical protein EBS69_06570, partial [Verrucomicrobia bacterium]|nr:hypothetical protein [Verrucomicrobiota bacterium]
SEAGQMGQVCWKKSGEVWEVRHLHDQNALGQLRGVASLDELDEVVRWDGRGRYRPLRSEGNLVSGWQYRANGEKEFREVMEVIYPGLWGNAEAWEEGNFTWQTWEEALANQTERVRDKVARAGNLPAKVVEENCRKRCLKTVVSNQWSRRERFGCCARGRAECFGVVWKISFSASFLFLKLRVECVELPEKQME